MPQNKTNKKILITGASGFIGSFLVEEGIRRGYTVYAGVRPGSSKIFLQNQAIRFFRIDLSSPELMERQFSRFNRSDGGFDYIIHNAGITRAHRKKDFHVVNCQYTQHLTNALIAAGRLPEKFIYISSMAVSGPGDPVSLAPIRPSDIQNPISAYAKSKLAAEDYIKSMHLLNSVIIRPTAVYGPRDRDFLAYFRMIAKGMEMYIGSRRQLLSFIYVKDLSRIVFQILSTAKPNTCYHVSDGNTYTQYDMGIIIKKILGRQTIKINLPRFPVLASIFFIEKIYALFGRMPFLHAEKIKEITAVNWSCDDTSLLEELSVKPGYTMEKAVTETIAWYRENGWLH